MRPADRRQPDAPPLPAWSLTLPSWAQTPASPRRRPRRGLPVLLPRRGAAARRRAAAASAPRR